MNSMYTLIEVEKIIPPRSSIRGQTRDSKRMFQITGNTTTRGQFVVDIAILLRLAMPQKKRRPIKTVYASISLLGNHSCHVMREPRDEDQWDIYAEKHYVGAGEVGILTKVM